MQYLLLTIVVFMVAAQNIVEKQYNVKVQNGNALLFAGMSSLVAMLFFVISSYAVNKPLGPAPTITTSILYYLPFNNIIALIYK